MAEERFRASRFRRAPGGRALVLGHRGARHAAPENTFLAFDLAKKEGADGVELDVRIDAQQELIVLHDTTLERVTGGACRARAESLSTHALRALDVGERERVPLLAEVLDWAKQHDLCLNIEIKSDVRDQRALLDGVVRLLTGETAAAEQFLLSSFHPRFVLALARRLPHLPVNWLVHRKQLVLRHAPAWRWLGAAGVNPEHTLLSAAKVEAWLSQQALVGTWTVNEPALAVAYEKFGVGAIISDFPGKIREALALETATESSTRAAAVART
jgi:glycerophosphoryl diester phosphodiesterase